VKLVKYIQELLLYNETVIIPGFGAFISTYKPAEIGEHEIKPPTKEISFNQQIKNNDGLLVGAVARKGKISQQNALKRIERDRENMLYQLDNGEQIVLEDLGTLSYNEQNEIQFTPSQNDNLLLDSFGLEPISIEDSVDNTLEKESTINLTEPVEPITEKPKINIRTEKANESDNEQKSATIKLPEYKHVPAIEKPKERKKANIFWYLFILIPIFIGGYFLINNKSNKTEINQESVTTEDETKIVIETQVPVDSTLNDSIVETAVIEVGNTKSVDNSSTENSKYYLVGGGFKSEENAEKYILRLKEKGIEGIRLGKRGSMFLVGIESFNTEQEAYNALNRQVKENPEWNLWVYKK
jgi:nucleoid DNA-binding protein